MSDRYDFAAMERKWQERWTALGLFRAPEKPRAGSKFYLLEMFPYPSGDIHMGHFWNYGLGDAWGRWLAMNGRDVLHPFGWDAFGLPAENAAIKRGVHPRDWTLANIDTSRATLQKIGISYDWDREFATCLPDYYGHTQRIFLLLWERGLIYRKDAPVNWCFECSTVLANEQVEDGKCWRCHREVGKRDLEQWYVKITDYAERLLQGLDGLTGWPASTVASQRNWIGKSEGAEVDFRVPAPGGERKITVFTTRPDTLWGVTFISVAPESDFGRFAAQEGPNAAEVAAYAAAAAKKTEMERTATDREKTGVRSGLDAIHPVTGERVPVYVADYALATYGTGCVMGVPAHDTRDFAFARKHGLGVKVVILPPSGTLDAATMTDAYTEPGTMTASPPFDGRNSDEAIPSIVAWLAEKGVGRARTTYRLRDWLFSRQRYWGCPIPMIHCGSCGVVPVPESDLPVLLPEKVTNWIPKGRSPLADVPEFVDVKCPKCGAAAQRDTDTMDTFIDSSWYMLRYTDPHNAGAPFEPARANAWLPIDLYIGGAEHANGHLIYFRFITKVLHDAGWLSVDEPVVRMLHNGKVHDADGRIMSKSLGNVVSPIDMMREYGVDASRVAMFFFARSDEDVRWSDSSAFAAKKFCQRVQALALDCGDMVRATPEGASVEGASARAKDVRRAAHEALRRFDQAFGGDLCFNTGIAGIYELLNAFPPPAEAVASPPADRAAYAEAIRLLVLMLTPIAPHLCEELHEALWPAGVPTVHRRPWPRWDPAALRRDEVEIAVQVLGKIKARVTVAADADEAAYRAAALAVPQVAQALAGREPKRVIVVKGRLVNLIV
jgi:leucyl-tRNA synthetase